MTASINIQARPTPQIWQSADTTPTPEAGQVFTQGDGQGFQQGDESGLAQGQ